MRSITTLLKIEEIYKNSDECLFNDAILTGSTLDSFESNKINRNIFIDDILYESFMFEYLRPLVGIYVYNKTVQVFLRKRMVIDRVTGMT